VKITRDIYFKNVGQEPIEDDLERCNCDKAGQPHHSCCGWNISYNKPVFMVGNKKKPEIPEMD